MKTTIVSALLMLAMVSSAVAQEKWDDYLIFKGADTLQVKSRDGQPGKKYEFVFTAVKDADVKVTGLWINNAHVSFATRIRIDWTSSKPLVNPKKGERLEIDYNTLFNKILDIEPVPLKTNATAVIQFTINDKTYYSEVSEIGVQDFIKED